MDKAIEAAAMALAPEMEGGREFDKMPIDRTQLREWARKAMCGFNDATQEDAKEAARAVLEAIIEALSALPAVGGWLDIESAPKDGSEILGWRADSGVLLIRWSSAAEFLTDAELDKWDEEAASQEDWFYADFVAGDRLEGDCLPTHWQPLPAPPIE